MPYKKGQCEHRHHTRRKPCDPWSCAARIQGRSWERGLEQSFPGTSREHRPTHTLIWDSQTPELRGNEILMFRAKPPSLRYFVTAALANEYSHTPQHTAQVYNLTTRTVLTAHLVRAKAERKRVGELSNGRRGWA